jgi:hypothetical protein
MAFLLGMWSLGSCRVIPLPQASRLWTKLSKRHEKLILLILKYLFA